MSDVELWNYPEHEPPAPEPQEPERTEDDILRDVGDFVVSDKARQKLEEQEQAAKERYWNDLHAQVEAENRKVEAVYAARRSRELYRMDLQRKIAAARRRRFQ